MLLLLLNSASVAEPLTLRGTEFGIAGAGIAVVPVAGRPLSDAVEGHGFIMTDTAPHLWWKRKPRTVSIEEAAQKVRKIAGTIERIASKQTVKEDRREVLKAIAPQLEQMPGFDWLTLYRTILLELHIRREQQAEQERQQEAEHLALRILRDEDDLLVLLMAA